MRFAYVQGRPTIQVALIGSNKNTLLIPAILDTGASISLVPASLAKALGINLDDVEPVEYTSANSTKGLYYPSEVTLKIVNKIDNLLANFEWKATVGFSYSRSEPGLIGHKSALTYFDVTFYGAEKCVSLTPNGQFSGEWTYLPVKS